MSHADDLAIITRCAGTETYSTVTRALCRAVLALAEPVPVKADAASADGLLSDHRLALLSIGHVIDCYGPVSPETDDPRAWIIYAHRIESAVRARLAQSPPAPAKVDRCAACDKESAHYVTGGPGMLRVPCCGVGTTCHARAHRAIDALFGYDESQPAAQPAPTAGCMLAVPPNAVRCEVHGIPAVMVCPEDPSLPDEDDITARLRTIADEAFGPFPVQTVEEALTAIEQGIFEQRRRLSRPAALDAERLAEADGAMSSAPSPWTSG